jgi:hypothetical protein
LPVGLERMSPSVDKFVDFCGAIPVGIVIFVVESTVFLAHFFSSVLPVYLSILPSP